MAGPVKIAILADASQATKELGQLGGALNDTATRLDAAGRASSKWADSLDFLGGASEKIAAGIGDVADGLAKNGIISEQAAESADRVAKSLLILTGAADIAVTASALFSAAKNAEILANTRAAASAVGAKVAMVASTVATHAATAAQWLFNTALSANPIGLIVIAIAALVAGFIYAYRHSERFRSLVDGAVRAVGAAFTWLWTTAKAVFASLVGAFTNVYGKAVAFRDNVVNTLLGIVTRLRNLGRDLMRGLVDGITDGLRWVRDKIKGLGNLIPGWLKSVLGIRSPSRIMRLIGRDTLRGYQAGLESQIPAIRRTIASVGGIVTGIGSGAQIAVGASTGVIAAPATGAVAYTINVNVPPTADPAEIGRQVVHAVEAHERRTGHRRLAPA